MKQLFNIHKIINFIIFLAIFKKIHLKNFFQNKINNENKNINKNSNSEEEDYKLLFVFEIMRHGARSPLELSSSSSSSEEEEDVFHEYWPYGKGELTSIGITQHFLIGYRNYLRYIKRFNFLKETYDPNEILLISTPLNRSLMSINAEIQGMFLPGSGPVLKKNESDIAVPPLKSDEYYKKEKEDLDKNQRYAAIKERINVLPVYTFDSDVFDPQMGTEKNCKALGSLYNKRQNSKKYKNFYNQLNNTFGEKLKNILKLNNTNFTHDRDIVNKITDAAIADYTENKNMSKIKDYLSIEEFKEFVENFAFNFSYLEYIGSDENHDEKIAKVSASQTFEYILDWMDKIKNEKSNLKFVLFSMHETNLGPFTYFLKMAFKTDIKYANFSANAHLEFYKDSSNDYYVNYLFNDESILNISYKNFKKKIRNLIMDKDIIHFYCNEENKHHVLVWILFSIIILLIIYLIFSYHKHKKKRLDVEKFILEN